MRFVGFSKTDYPSIPPVLRMNDGYGKFVLLLNDRLQPPSEGILLAGDIDRHALLVALYLDKVLGLRSDLTTEEVDKIILNPIYASVGRGLVPSAGRYYFSSKQVCHVGWGSSGWAIYDPPLDKNLTETIKTVLEDGLKNESRLWAK